MRTLKDVYIKVTARNKEELYTLLNRKIRIGYFLYFLSDDIKTSWLTPDIELNKQKVSLSELKRLIDTIPTRDEIKRLKQQISAYKTNYDKVVKHSLSKEDELEFFRIENESLKNIILTLELTNNHLYDKKDTLLKENAQLKKRKWWQIWK